MWERFYTEGLERGGLGVEDAEGILTNEAQEKYMSFLRAWAVEELRKFDFKNFDDNIMRSALRGGSSFICYVNRDLEGAHSPHSFAS